MKSDDGQRCFEIACVGFVIKSWDHSESYTSPPLVSTPRTRGMPSQSGRGGLGLEGLLVRPQASLGLLCLDWGWAEPRAACPCSLCLETSILLKPKQESPINLFIGFFFFFFGLMESKQASLWAHVKTLGGQGLPYGAERLPIWTMMDIHSFSNNNYKDRAVFASWLTREEGKWG